MLRAPRMRLIQVQIMWLHLTDWIAIKTKRNSHLCKYPFGFLPSERVVVSVHVSRVERILCSHSRITVLVLNSFTSRTIQNYWLNVERHIIECSKARLEGTLCQTRTAKNKWNNQKGCYKTCDPHSISSIFAILVFPPSCVADDSAVWVRDPFSFSDRLVRLLSFRKRRREK